MSDTYQIEKLEDRMLLAVGVSFKAKKGILVIKSDAAGDEVDVVGTGTFGEVDVYVDGGFVGTFSGVKTIKANMGAGDDDLSFSAVQIGGSIVAKMGAGADIFDMDVDNEFDEVDGDVFIGGSVIVKMGNNAGDVVDIDTIPGGEGGGDFGIIIGNNMTLAGVDVVSLDGGGGSCDVEMDDITIGGFLRIRGKGLDNVVFVDDVNVGGTTIVSLGGGDDDLIVSDSSFARRVGVTLGGGDDDVILAGNCFSAAVVVNGGGGDNALVDAGGNTFAVAPVLKKITPV